MKKNMKVKITSEIPSPLQTIPNSCGGNEEICEIYMKYMKYERIG